MKYNTFEEFLLESPIRGKGDAEFEEMSDGEYILYISKKVMDEDYTLIKRDFFATKAGNSFDLYKHSGNMYVLGEFVEVDGKERFGVINNLTFKTLPSHVKSLKTKVFDPSKIIAIQTVHTFTKWRGNGISSALYNYIVFELGYTIVSDSIQFKGAIQLWKNFPTVDGCVVYIYDILEDKIISKYTSNTPDTHVWSDDTSKMRIRLVFTKQ